MFQDFTDKIQTFKNRTFNHRKNLPMQKSQKSKFKKRYIAFAILSAYLIMCQSCMTMRTTPSKTKEYFEDLKVVYVDKTVSIEGNSIHYIQTGDEQNPTLFFVHGSPGSWNAFKRYLSDSLLLQKYRMIAVDRPGFGYSDFGAAEDLKTQAKWIAAFLKTINNKQPIVLVGHSLGGPVVAKMATQNPTLYKHLVILSGALDPAAEKTEKWRKIIKMKPLRYLIPGALRPSNDELWWLKSDLLEMKPELINITSDVTIIHGTKDPLVPYSNVYFMKNAFANAKSIEVTAIIGANHFIPWEYFETIRKALLELKL